MGIIFLFSIFCLCFDDLYQKYFYYILTVFAFYFVNFFFLLYFILVIIFILIQRKQINLTVMETFWCYIKNIAMLFLLFCVVMVNHAIFLLVVCLVIIAMK